MKRAVFSGVICVFSLTATGLAGLNTTIIYQANDLGGGQWQYTYEVTNNSLSVPIEEFTVWFDYGLYANLVVDTPTTPAHWDQLVLQPEPVLLDDGAFDAKVNDTETGAGIGLGQTLGGFAVSFDWLGVGRPGPQPYDIIDPQTFQPIDSGMTVIPEPATLLLLGLGGLILHTKRWTAR